MLLLNDNRDNKNNLAAHVAPRKELSVLSVLSLK